MAVLYIYNYIGHIWPIMAQTISWYIKTDPTEIDLEIVNFLADHDDQKIVAHSITYDVHLKRYVAMVTYEEETEEGLGL